MPKLMPKQNPICREVSSLTGTLLVSTSDMARLTIGGEPVQILRMRLRQVCEKYKTKRVQLLEMRKEISELKRLNMISGNDEDFEALILEVLNTFGTNQDLK